MHNSALSFFLVLLVIAVKYITVRGLQIGKNSLLGLLINSILFVTLESLFRICESNTSFPLFLDEKRYFQATYQSGDLMISFQAEHHRTATAGEEKSLLLPNLVIFYIQSITRRPKLVPLYE